MDAVREHLHEIQSGAFGTVEVIAVTFTDPANLASYRKRFADPLPVVSDEHRELYRILGFGRGSVWRVWGLRALRRYVSLVRSGSRLERLHEDTLQLGGNAIVDQDGKLLWRYAGSGPDDRPSVEEIMRALHASG